MKLKTMIAGATLTAVVMLGLASVLPGAEVKPAAPVASASTTGEQTSSLLLPTSDLDSRVAALRATVEARPDDPRLHADLGIALLQIFRDEAEPSFLPDAHEALSRSLELQPDGNEPAYVGMASLSNARHDFSASVKWSRRAIETNRYGADAYGLLGDALFELGSADAAADAYQHMVDLRPDVASYVRASYTLQYQGRTGAAIRAMRQALQAAGPAGETAAFVRHQLGDIYSGLGKIRRSARENRDGVAVAPGYVPPTVGVAESYISRGRLDRAIPIMERAVEKLPTLEYMLTLAELYDATGRGRDARQAYGAAAQKLSSYRAAGVLPDADFILFYADHGLRLKAAVREATAIYENRPTGKTADALAWVLHSQGRDAKAWRYADEALHAPDADATTRFHVAAIAFELGRDEVAMRLLERSIDEGLSPSHSVIAHALLEEMRR